MTTILLPIRREPTVAEGDELQALLDDMVEIPLLGSVAAGQPIEAWEQQELVLVQEEFVPLTHQSEKVTLTIQELFHFINTSSQQLNHAHKDECEEVPQHFTIQFGTWKLKTY